MSTFGSWGLKVKNLNHSLFLNSRYCKKFIDLRQKLLPILSERYETARRSTRNNVARANQSISNSAQVQRDGVVKRPAAHSPEVRRFSANHRSRRAQGTRAMAEGTGLKPHQKRNGYIITLVPCYRLKIIG